MHKIPTYVHTRKNASKYENENEYSVYSEYVLRFARKRDKIIQSRQVANYPITSNLQICLFRKIELSYVARKTLKCHNALFAKSKAYCIPFGGYQRIINDD